MVVGLRVGRDREGPGQCRAQPRLPRSLDTVLSCGHKMAPPASSSGSCPLSLGASVLCVGTLASWLPAAGGVGFCRPFLRVPASAPEVSPSILHCSLAFSDLDASGGHFLGLGSSNQSVGSAAVAIVAPSLAQCPCKMPQLPPPYAFPGLGETPDPGARSQYFEGLG